MSLVQRIVYAIRALTEDEPYHSKKKHARRRRRNNNRQQQAVALVITFRDLFAARGLNYLLDDVESNPKSSKRRTQDDEQANNTPETKASVKEPRLDFTSDLTLPTDLKMPPSEAWYVDLPQSLESVPLLHEERVISSSEIALLNSSISSSSVVPVESTSREIDVLQPWNQRKKNVVVALKADDENKTVATLRKVLKWSPRKQSAATFALEVPTEEKHKAVAVVENAVNRVKEEQQQKKKRKLKLFKLTFC